MLAVVLNEAISEQWVGRAKPQETVPEAHPEVIDMRIRLRRVPQRHGSSLSSLKPALALPGSADGGPLPSIPAVYCPAHSGGQPGVHPVGPRWLSTSARPQDQQASSVLEDAGFGDELRPALFEPV